MQTDARLKDIVLSLNHNPENFLKGILGSFYRSGVNRDKAVVRLGVSGTGKQPHYCIEQGPRENIVLIADIEVRGFEHREVFNGRSHKLILEEKCMGKNWSSSAASYADVQSLLGVFRSSKKQH